MGNDSRLRLREGICQLTRDDDGSLVTELLEDVRLSMANS
jgi:hypothetical protein